MSSIIIRRTNQQLVCERHCGGGSAAPGQRQRESFTMKSPRESRDLDLVMMIDAGTAETHHTSPEN